MISCTYRARFAQRGVVLISSLLLLIVVTIIALSLFRSFGMQEKIAGNMREKQRALQAAESAQVFAEIWLSNNATGLSVTCAGMLNGTIGEGQICANTLPTVVPNGDVTIVPWTITGVPVGVTYLPTGPTAATTMSINNASILTYSQGNLANPTYFGTPTFYISDMGHSADPGIPGEVYQVDAYGYGGSKDTVAVVESTYAVYTSSSNRTL
jgi:type IV pilus assembly protein PilX